MPQTREGPSLAGRAVIRGYGRLLPLALFALAGCESAHWAKPGATTAEVWRDLADCERIATGSTPFHFWALGLSYEQARDRIGERKATCVTERGWRPTAD